jgi:2-isopropylmalate synthase
LRGRGVLAEDASRSDFGYLCEVLSLVIEAGARTINIPDTVGYAVPKEWGELIATFAQGEGVENVVVSVHCHNDLAWPCQLAGRRGERRPPVECTINGIGERAGNASLEELVMACARAATSSARHPGEDGGDLHDSRLLSHITGVHVQPNKAIVGENAFAHEAGIHQDGVLKEKLTYEIMKPEDIGRPSNKLVLGKHSGRHALAVRLKDLGFDLSAASSIVPSAPSRTSLIARRRSTTRTSWPSSRTRPRRARRPTSSIISTCSADGDHPVGHGEDRKDGQPFQESGIGDGPVDAVLAAIDAITGLKGRLQDYAVRAAHLRQGRHRRGSR